MREQPTRLARADEGREYGITAVSIQGFKSHAVENRIDIRNLTILAGANSSGKSSIVQPLLLMKQTLEASYDPGPLLLNGPNMRCTSVEQLLSRTQADGHARSFAVGIETDGVSNLRTEFTYSENQELEIGSMSIELPTQPSESSFWLTEGDDSAVIEERLSGFLPAIGRRPYRVSDGFKLACIRNRCFLHLVELEARDDTYGLSHDPK